MELRPPLSRIEQYQSEATNLSFADDRIALVLYFLGSVSFSSSFVLALLTEIVGMTRFVATVLLLVPVVLWILVFPLKAAAWYRLRTLGSDCGGVSRGKPLAKFWVYGMSAEVHYLDYLTKVYLARSWINAEKAVRASKVTHRDLLNQKADKLRDRANRRMTKANILRSTLSESNLSPEKHYRGFIFLFFRFLNRKLDSELEKKKLNKEMS